MYECPVEDCDRTAETYADLTRHWGGKRDKAHMGGMPDESEIPRVGGETDQDEDNTGASGAGETGATDATDARDTNPLMNAPESTSVDSRSGGDTADRDETGDIDVCCGEPDLEPLPPGSRFELNDGRSGRTEPGDQQCKSCGALVDSDGEIYR